jgi:ligand-binding SRPBCC domain-containing protein
MEFVKESLIPASVEEVFAFQERPEAFELLLPPWEKHRVSRPPSGLEVGTRVELETKVGPFWVPIVAEHVAYEPGVRFEDVMRRGPFARWHHKHLFLPHEEGCVLRDQIDYAPPGWFLGRLLDPLLVRPKLKRLFDYRHEITRREVLAAGG